MNFKFLILIGGLLLINYANCETAAVEVIETVDDNNLVYSIKGEESVVVLFTKNDCADCVEYEKVLEQSQADLKETLNAIVVKLYNSPMVSLYDPNKEPALVFFRRGIPLLYHGALQHDEILQTFNDNREPAVKELSDANFEHLTQASSGATTGDWYIFLCQRLFAIWEAVAAYLKRRLNVARMNRLENAIATSLRFHVETSPSFLYIRQGECYKYFSTDFTPSAFINFVENTYVEAENFAVPKEAGSFIFIEFFERQVYVIYLTVFLMLCWIFIPIAIRYIRYIIALKRQPPVITVGDKQK